MEIEIEMYRCQRCGGVTSKAFAPPDVMTAGPRCNTCKTDGYLVKIQWSLRLDSHTLEMHIDVD